MNYPSNVPTSPTAPVVHEDGAVYTASGDPVPDPDVRAARVADEAVRWAAFASERSRMRPETVYAKAVHAAAFSARHGAAHLAVPTKLAGTSKHQAALWALVRDPAAPWAALSVEAAGGGAGAGPPRLVVSHGDDVLGEVQTKHCPWLRPLVPFGARVHLGRVTGAAYDGYTLGLNVALAVGEALGRLLDAIGDGDAGGDGHRGDGHRGGAPTTAPEATPRPPLRLVVPDPTVAPEHTALEGAPDDVVLYRDVTGAPHASVPVAGRVDWGPSADPEAALVLARAVLVAVDEDLVADALAVQFAEVLRRLPHAGGVVRAASVRTWIQRTTPGGTA